MRKLSEIENEEIFNNFEVNDQIFEEKEEIKEEGFIEKPKIVKEEPKMKKEKENKGGYKSSKDFLKIAGLTVSGILLVLSLLLQHMQFLIKELSFLDNIQTIKAVINAKKVYISVATRPIPKSNIPKIAKTTATINNIAKKVIATKIGHLSILCKTIDKSTIAIGNAKNISNKFILFLLLCLF